MTRVLAGLILGALSMNNFASERADAIYRIGPETLLRETSLVAVGKLSKLTKDVTTETEGEPIPISWTVSGEITKLSSIKGQLRFPNIAIVRKEQAMFAMGSLDEPSWTQDYGELIDGATAIVFVNQSVSNTADLVVPNGSGELNLYQLLKQAEHVASFTDKNTRITAVAQWFNQATTNAEKKAALRMLLHDKAPWPIVSKAIEAIWKDSNAQLQQYFTGISGFGIMSGVWPASDEQPLSFLCREFINADARLASGIMLQLKQLLIWSEREKTNIAMIRIGQIITDCYRQRLANKPLNSELKKYFEQLDPKYDLR